MPRFFSPITVLLTSMLLMSSCLKEDTSNCPEQIRVYFAFTTRAAGNQIDPADVDRMHLYVFCEEGYFLREYRDDSISGFSTDYFMDCSELLPGKYRFIAWGGKNEDFYATTPATFVEGKTTFEEALLELKHEGSTVDTRLPHIFHAHLPETVITYEKEQRIDMPLMQLSNTINIRTIGLQSNDYDYIFSITDNNCSYRFDAAFAPHSHAELHYIAPCAKNNDQQISASLNVLRLMADRRTPQLRIYDGETGRQLYPFDQQSGDLIGLILSAMPYNNFDTTHLYDIVLDFTGSSTEITLTITINGWKVYGQNNVLTD